jgi:hypothetical protein
LYAEIEFREESSKWTIALPRQPFELKEVLFRQQILAIFEKVGVFPRALRGQRVRVRGLIETNTGPRMEIASPAELELLDRGAAQ